MPEPLIKEFYDSLTAPEKEAHYIAARMLGSSYVVEKTHSYIKWLKRQQQDQKS